MSYLAPAASTALPSRRRARNFQAFACGDCTTCERRRQCAGRGLGLAVTTYPAGSFPAWLAQMARPPITAFPVTTTKPIAMPAPLPAPAPAPTPVSTAAPAPPTPAPAANPPGGPPSTVLKYDTAGNPVYAVPPPGQVVTGYDSAGNPIWGSPSAALPAAGYAAAPAQVTVEAPAPAESGYQAILDWLSQSTLVSGLPNWGLVAAAGFAVVMIQRRSGRYR